VTIDFGIGCLAFIGVRPVLNEVSWPFKTATRIVLPVPSSPVVVQLQKEDGTEGPDPASSVSTNSSAGSSFNPSAYLLAIVMQRGTVTD